MRNARETFPFVGFPKTHGQVFSAVVNWKENERKHHMKRYKAILYDIDGTLLNTLDMNMYPLMRIIREELGEEWTFDQVTRFAAQPGRKTLADLGIRDIDTVYARWVRYVNEYGKGAEPFDGIPELLTGLRELGLRQAIVSSKHARQYAIDMGRHGFDAFMETAVLCEDTVRHKPDPAPLNECLRRMGLNASDALYLGDARSDLEAARNAGMDFAYASWGSHSPVAREEADYWLEHPLELMVQLRNAAEPNE